MFVLRLFALFVLVISSLIGAVGSALIAMPGCIGDFLMSRRDDFDLRSSK